MSIFLVIACMGTFLCTGCGAAAAAAAGGLSAHGRVMTIFPAMQFLQQQDLMCFFWMGAVNLTLILSAYLSLM
jgi:hypothetical protein